MSRMKTFFTYALIIVAFYVYSTLVTNVLLNNSYINLAATTQVNSEDGINIDVINVKANKRRGTFTGQITNTSSNLIEKKYIKVSAYDGDIFLQSRYLEVNNLESGETREFTAKFTADGIDNYKVELVDEVPEERTIIDDAIDTVKQYITSADKKFKTIDITEYNIPDWGWITAIGIILYYIPSGAIWFII